VTATSFSHFARQIVVVRFGFHGIGFDEAAIGALEHISEHRLSAALGFLGFEIWPQVSSIEKPPLLLVHTVPESPQGR